MVLRDDSTRRAFQKAAVSEVDFGRERRDVRSIRGINERLGIVVTQTFPSPIPEEFARDAIQGVIEGEDMETRDFGTIKVVGLNTRGWNFEVEDA